MRVYSNTSASTGITHFTPDAAAVGTTRFPSACWTARRHVACSHPSMPPRSALRSTHAHATKKSLSASQSRTACARALAVSGPGAPQRHGGARVRRRHAVSRAQRRRLGAAHAPARQRARPGGPHAAPSPARRQTVGRPARLPAVVTAQEAAARASTLPRSRSEVRGRAPPGPPPTPLQSSPRSTPENQSPAVSPDRTERLRPRPVRTPPRRRRDSCKGGGGGGGLHVRTVRGRAGAEQEVHFDQAQRLD